MEFGQWPSGKGTVFQPFGHGSNPIQTLSIFSEPKNWYINIKNKILLGASPSGGAGGAQPLTEGLWGSRPEKSKIKARNKKARN